MPNDPVFPFFITFFFIVFGFVLFNIIRSIFNHSTNRRNRNEYENTNSFSDSNMPVDHSGFILFNVLNAMNQPSSDPGSVDNNSADCSTNGFDNSSSCDSGSNGFDSGNTGFDSGSSGFDSGGGFSDGGGGGCDSGGGF